MTTSVSSIRAALGSIVILSAVTGVAIVSNSFAQPSLAASKNFAAKCEGITGNVKGLAIEPIYSNQQLCACAATNKEFRRQIGAAGIKCNENQITNFNQTAITTPDTTEPPTPPTPGEPPKGNNGWGNGAEGTNNGSDEGNLAQATSKTDESGSIGKNGRQGER
jgi:hypothetical protein